MVDLKQTPKILWVYKVLGVERAEGIGASVTQEYSPRAFLSEPVATSLENALALGCH
jgi:hypothetical protein